MLEMRIICNNSVYLEHFIKHKEEDVWVQVNE